MTEPERLARLHDGFYSEADDMPRIVKNWHQREDDADRTRHEYMSATQFVCGWLAILAIVAVIWGVM